MPGETAEQPPILKETLASLDLSQDHIRLLRDRIEQLLQSRTYYRIYPQWHGSEPWTNYGPYWFLPLPLDPRVTSESRPRPSDLYDIEPPRPAKGGRMIFFLEKGKPHDTKRATIACDYMTGKYVTHREALVVVVHQGDKLPNSDPHDFALLELGDIRKSKGERGWYYAVAQVVQFLDTSELGEIVQRAEEVRAFLKGIGTTVGGRYEGFPGIPIDQPSLELLERLHQAVEKISGLNVDKIGISESPESAAAMGKAQRKMFEVRQLRNDVVRVLQGRDSLSPGEYGVRERNWWRDYGPFAQKLVDEEPNFDRRYAKYLRRYNYLRKRYRKEAEKPPQQRSWPERKTPTWWDADRRWLKLSSDKLRETREYQTFLKIALLARELGIEKTSEAVIDK